MWRHFPKVSARGDPPRPHSAPKFQKYYIFFQYILSYVQLSWTYRAYQPVAGASIRGRIVLISQRRMSLTDKSEG